MEFYMFIRYSSLKYTKYFPAGSGSLRLEKNIVYPGSASKNNYDYNSDMDIDGLFKKI